MKKILLALSVVIGLIFAVKAADQKAATQHTYEGAITGVVCVSCKEHITAALTQKLPGVVSVDVKPGKTPDAQKLTIVSTGAEVTKESATAALGTFAKNYQILSLEKKE